MNVIETKLPGVVIIEPKVFGDHRGFFMESYSHQRYTEAGIEESFVQDNISYSSKGVLRGLHFQNPNAQGKLVHVLQGEVFDVAVDIRRGSPTFGQWAGVVLSGENKKQFYVPPDFAHGFVVTSETALFAYKCTAYYSPNTEGSLRWDDPAVGIEWPIDSPTLAAKDADAPLLKDIPKSKLPVFHGAK